jgi:hypothetical protein
MYAQDIDLQILSSRNVKNFEMNERWRNLCQKSTFPQNITWCVYVWLRPIYLSHYLIFILYLTLTALSPHKLTSFTNLLPPCTYFLTYMLPELYISTGYPQPVTQPSQWHKSHILLVTTEQRIGRLPKYFCRLFGTYPSYHEVKLILCCC